MRRFFSDLISLIYGGLVVVILLAYLAPLVPPDRFWPLAFLGLAYPYLMLANLAFCGWWLFRRSKKFLFPLFLLLLGWGYFQNSFQLIRDSNSSKQGVDILSYNVHYFESDLHDKRANNHHILDYIRSCKAEIICLQEISVTHEGRFSVANIRTALPALPYVHQAASGSYSGMITLSAFPILNAGEIRFSRSSNMVLFTDLKVSPSLTCRVYNCHLQSYKIDPSEYSILDSLTSGSNSRSMQEAKRISYKLQRGFKYRAVQARRLAEHIRKSPYPVIVCGDFNDTPVSYAYRTVRGEFRDAFVEAGWGISNTYHGSLPSFRIDYLLYSSRFKATDYGCDARPYSDHYPVHTRLQVN